MPNVSASPDARLLERSLAHALWQDPLLRFGLLGAVGLATLIATQASAVPQLTAWVPLVSVLGVVMCMASGITILPRQERRFWWLWTAALGVWAATYAGVQLLSLEPLLGQLPAAGAPLTKKLMVVDVGRMMFFFLVAMALLNTLGNGGQRSTQQPTRYLQPMGMSIIVFGLVLYFGVLPLRAHRPLAAADDLMLELGSLLGLALAAAHLFLVLRRGTSRRWRVLHGLLACALALWALGGAWWFVALVALAVAARFRHWLPAEPGHAQPASVPLAGASNLLVPAAVVLPLLHLTACGFDLLDPSLRPMREVVVLLAAAGIGTLAIVEQRRLRQASWAAEQRTMRFAEAAFEGIAEIADGRIIGANHQLATMFGYTAGGLEGRGIAELIGPVDRKRLSKRLRRARRLPIEVQGLRRDRTTFRAEIRTRGYADAAATTQAIAVCDITDRLDLEAKLQQAQKAEIAGRLVGGLARDFNNQLTVILGRSELMLLEEARPSRKDIEEIRQAAEAAASVTRQLLIFAGPQQPAPRVVDLGEVLSAVADSFLERVIPLETKLVVDRESECLPVRADRHQLEQLILGLSLRALDGVPVGSTLQVRAALAPAGLVTGSQRVELEIWVTPPFGFAARDPDGEETPSRSSTSLSTQDSALAAMVSIAKRNGAILTADEDMTEGEPILRYRVHFPVAAI